MTRLFRLQELDAVAREVLQHDPSARVFALHGDLGAGKTTLVQAFLRQLGVAEPGGSPTFSLVHTYQVRPYEVHHFDMYRLNNVEEALAIGFPEAYLLPGTYAFIEWPERVAALLPPETVHLRLEHPLDAADDERWLTVNA